jgi:hypothetical protein
MVIKCVGYDGELKISKRLWRSNWNEDHVQMDFEYIIGYNYNGGDDGGFGKKWRSPLKWLPQTLKMFWMLDYLYTLDIGKRCCYIEFPT